MAWKVIGGEVVVMSTGEILTGSRRKQPSGWYMDRVKAAGKLATAPEVPADGQLFAVTPETAKRPRERGVRCGMRGPVCGWLDAKTPRALNNYRPVCNRMPGHAGPHEYLRKRDLIAQARWE